MKTAGPVPTGNKTDKVAPQYVIVVFQERCEIGRVRISFTL